MGLLSVIPKGRSISPDTSMNHGVGPEIATKVYNSGLTYDEYYVTY